MIQKKKWICSVCGYVVEGENSPDSCPVCGAGSEYFKEEDLEVDMKEEVDNNGWRCLICGYECDDLPDTCPICAASKSQFVSFSKTALIDEVDNDKTVVIIGSGIAALSAAQAIRESQDMPGIIIITADKEYPYYRLNLTRYLAGEIKNNELFIKDKSWFEENKIDIRFGMSVTSLNKNGYYLTLQNNEVVKYSKLIICSGAHPFMPPFDNNNKENISMIRTLDDVEKVNTLCGQDKKFVIIGGGILGLEVAGALAHKGENVKLIEGYNWLLPRQLNKVAGDFLQEYAEKIGIKFEKNVRVDRFTGEDIAESVLLQDGVVLKADHFIITTGVRSNTFLALEAGLTVNNGVVVNDFMQTSEKDIYAAGDVCEHNGILYGTWAPAQYQGAIAGMNAIGRSVRFEGIPRTNLLKVLGIDMFSIGEINTPDASYRELEFSENGSYYFFNFKDEKLVGAILLGDSGKSSSITHALENNVSCNMIVKNSVKLADVLDFFTF